MIRGIVSASIMAMLATLVSPALADCGKCHEKKAACGSPCEAKASPCEAKVKPCKVKASPCEAKCKTKATACGGCETKCKAPKAHADIERLKVVKAECSDQLCVSYEADIERQCGDYDLIIQVKDKCHRILYERVVALDAPYRSSDQGTENHYRGTFSDTLAQGADSAGGLYVEGNVVSRGTRTSIDREREIVRHSDKDHGYATVLYRTADVAYMPVGYISRPFISQN